MKKIKFSKSEQEKLFLSTVTSRAKKKLGVDNLLLRPNMYFWLKALFWFISCWVSYYLILFSNYSGFTKIFLAINFQLSGLLVGFSIGHDASHRVISEKKNVNEFFHYLSFITIGIDPILWGLRHLRSHHLYPNIDGSDIDIDRNPLLRLSPNHPRKLMHKFQHLYAPFAYSIALLHSVFWGDWIYLFSKEYYWMRKGVNKIKLVFSFFINKIIYFSLALAIPYYVLDYAFYEIFLVYILTSAIISLVFIIMLVGTHFFLEADYPKASGGSLNSSWAGHNLATSCDWNPESKVARFLVAELIAMQHTIFFQMSAMFIMVS